LETQRIETPEDWVTPKLLSWARSRVGLTPDAVHSLIDIPKERLEAWESGGEAPSLSDMETLAELYDCPVGYFFLRVPPQEALPLSFRGIAEGKLKGLSYESHMSLREFLRLVDTASRLANELGKTWEPAFGSARLGDPVEDVVSREVEHLGITADVKARWLSADAAFQGWRAAIEEQGIFVITLKLNPGEIRGASTWTAPSPPAILVNHANIEAATGRTFTLLHEYAHLLLRKAGYVCDFRGHGTDRKVERFANCFAAEAMVPRSELVSFLRDQKLYVRRENWGDPTLDRIRAPFRASRDTVAILLEEIELAPRGFYRRKRAMWDRRKPFGRGGKGGRVAQAQQRLRELGGSLSRLLAEGYRRKAISPLDLADLLKMRLERAEAFVSWVQGVS